MFWYIALNTFTPGLEVAPGTVISSHKTEEAAHRACKAAQPRDRNSYLPTAVILCARYCRRGMILDWAEVDPTELDSD